MTRVASERPRAAMIVNPYSSGMTSKRERAIVRELREHMELEVHRTERGGHAPLIASDLIDRGHLDVIIACGGDGTANEVLTGMSLGDDTADARPSLVIIPGGGTNVLARSVGLPNHPVRATKPLIDAIVERRQRPINIATVDERLFMFSAGVGLDAEVVKRMDARRSGRRPSDTAHLVSILGIYTQQRFRLEDTMTVHIEDTDEELRCSLLMVGNTTPLTYMGRIPVHFMPEASLDAGMDLLAPSRVNAMFSMRAAAQSMGARRASRTRPAGHSKDIHHDVERFTVRCDEPQPVQVDGEYIGDRTDIQFGLWRNAVNLVA